jgi:hypothetical protein
VEFDKDFEDLKNDMFSLPWLVNGSLDAAETTRLRKAVEKSPQLQKELDFLISLQTQVKNKAQTNTKSDIAWKRLSRDMKNNPNTSNLSHFSNILPKLSKYSAIAATLVIGVYLSTSYKEEKPSDFYDPLSSDQKSLDTMNQVNLVIRFNESMSQLEIDKLLNIHHLVIRSGPSAAGLYHVHSIDKQDSDILIRKLEMFDEQIEYVQLNE